MFLREALKNTGINMIYAENGKEALEIIKSNRDINLVLMDIKMPGMDGFDTTRKIKQVNPDLYVIAQTAFASEHDKQKTKEAGCDDYISKPICKDVLIEKIIKYTKSDEFTYLGTSKPKVRGRKKGLN